MFYLWFLVVLNSIASGTCHETFVLRRLRNNYLLVGVKGLGSCGNDTATQKHINKRTR